MSIQRAKKNVQGKIKLAIMLYLGGMKQNGVYKNYCHGSKCIPFCAAKHVASTLSHRHLVPGVYSIQQQLKWMAIKVDHHRWSNRPDNIHFNVLMTTRD